MSRRILVVEDERTIRELLEFNLRQDGYSVDSAVDGIEAVDLVNQVQYDLVVLDLMLPKLDGIEVCKHIRQKYNYSVYILMLTARGEEVDRIVGFEVGADDYMVKPFSPRELLVRIKAAFRRREATSVHRPVLSGGGLVLDRDQYICRYKGKVLDLTPKQFALLGHLLENKGRVCSREELLAAVWGFDFYGDTRTVDVHISQIRQQLQQAAGSEDVPIETLRGVGYRFRGKD